MLRVVNALMKLLVVSGWWYWRGDGVIVEMVLLMVNDGVGNTTVLLAKVAITFMFISL